MKLICTRMRGPFGEDRHDHRNDFNYGQSTSNTMDLPVLRLQQPRETG